MIRSYCIIEIKTYFFISRKLPANCLLSIEGAGNKDVVTETENVTHKCFERPHVGVQIRHRHVYDSPQFLSSLLDNQVQLTPLIMHG